MALDTYNKKRDFSRTPEPKGGKAKRRAGHSFVIQKHDATRLHYDFRLEMDGVLKSWAVTRGPSLVPSEKRLAVHVEDHPLDYGTFEGTIPKGEYGGGTVLLWDRGTWKPIGDAKKGMTKGHLEFELDGEKLSGRWHLVRMARRPREKRDNWLLIKGDDEHAREEGDTDILEEKPQSVKTGRGLPDIAKEAPGWSSKTGRIRKADEPDKAIKGACQAKMPDFVPPQLATLKRHPPTGSGWIHEIKFDGYRLQAHLDAGKVKLLTRSGLDWTDRFGKAVPKALAALAAKQAIIDGELVVEASGGASDFSALQADLSEGRDDRFAFYAFDLLYLDGKDLEGAALRTRKSMLSRLLDDAAEELRYSDHFEENGEMVLRHACRLSLEGVVSKRADGTYHQGRSRDWIKSKCGDKQEMVIAGYVPSSVSDKAIGSLVLGVFEDGKLRHAGRVGTGFARAVAEDLYKRLNEIERKDSPFAAKLDATARRGVHFVEPKLVAEVEFRDWTADGLLRHAAFRGLREDKPAKEVVREDAAAAPARKKPARPSPGVRLTHPDRVYWEDAGVTKEGLASYYAQVWRFMAPHIVSRPLALIRCPGGTSAQCFFQKHGWKGMSGEILTVPDPQDDEPVIAIDSLDGLIGLVQGATLEIHPWQAALDDLEKPDQMVIDLDPADDVSWSAVLDAARQVRERLEAAKLAAFVKTTGGKGLHVVAPLKPKAGWDVVKGFARDLAEAMEADDPTHFISKASKAARKGRIFVDYLRNGRGATAIAPYSTRARAGASVAMPLGWDELEPSIRSNHFTVANAMTRLDSLSVDPWADFRKAERPLETTETKSRKGK